MALKAYFKPGGNMLPMKCQLSGRCTTENPNIHAHRMQVLPFCVRLRTSSRCCLVPLPTCVNINRCSSVIILVKRFGFVHICGSIFISIALDVNFSISWSASYGIRTRAPPASRTDGPSEPAFSATRSYEHRNNEPTR